jgi:hypothetical protein
LLIRLFLDSSPPGLFGICLLLRRLLLCGLLVGLIRCRLLSRLLLGSLLLFSGLL